MLIMAAHQKKPFALGAILSNKLVVVKDRKIYNDVLIHVILFVSFVQSD